MEPFTRNEFPEISHVRFPLRNETDVNHSHWALENNKNIFNSQFMESIVPDTFPLITHITFTTKKTETAVNLPNNNRKTNRKFDPKISRPVKRESFPKISHVTFPSKNEINMNDGCWDQRKNNNIFDLSVTDFDATKDSTMYDTFPLISHITFPLNNKPYDISNFWIHEGNNNQVINSETTKPLSPVVPSKDSCIKYPITKEKNKNMIPSPKDEFPVVSYYTIPTSNEQNSLKIEENPKKCSQASNLRNQHSVKSIESATNDEFPVVSHVTFPSIKELDLCNIDQALEKSNQVFYSNQKKHPVTLKIDVSHSEHAYIIGKKGSTIKKLQSETNCIININVGPKSPGEKSGIVSLKGLMADVENCRARIRESVPLFFQFKMPKSHIQKITSGDPDRRLDKCVNWREETFTTFSKQSLYVKWVQDNYRVQVEFLERADNDDVITVKIQGFERKAAQIIEATQLLVDHVSKNLEESQSPIQVQTTMEIAPYIHGNIVGKGGKNIKNMRKFTKTEITFPDLADNTIPKHQKSCITVTGTAVDKVYLARQQLIGSLPLYLAFDLPKNLDSLANSENVARLMQQYSCSIYVNRSVKQGKRIPVVVSGRERNASKIYEVRRQLLNCEEPLIEALLPAGYYKMRPVSYGTESERPETDSFSSAGSVTSGSSSSNKRAVNTASFLAASLKRVNLGQGDL